MANWEKLWRCESLSNVEFLSLLKSEKDKFYKKELENVFEVAHLAGILLSLEKRGLVKLNRGYVVSNAKRTIIKIHKIYPNDIARLALNSQGYEFQESDSTEMKDILSFASSLLQKQIERIEKEYIVNAWDRLVPGMTLSEIEALFDQSKPTHLRRYSMDDIFTQASPKSIAEKIVALPSATKLEFAHFLMGRYYLKGTGIVGTLSAEMMKDKESLGKISRILKSKAKRLKLIEKEQTLLIASKMDEAAAKM